MCEFREPTIEEKHNEWLSHCEERLRREDRRTAEILVLLNDGHDIGEAMFIADARLAELS